MNILFKFGITVEKIEDSVFAKNSQVAPSLPVCLSL